MIMRRYARGHYIELANKEDSVLPNGYSGNESHKLGFAS